MPLSRISLENFQLYVIVDREALGSRAPVTVAEAAIRGGADLIQWRDKKATDREFLSVARELRALTRQLKIPLILNDRVDAAILIQADGVHLGGEDLPIQEARSLVGDSMVIGRSTHSLVQAKEAQAAGADYMGVGPIFPTPTKPDHPSVGLDLIAQVKKEIRIPWVAIGGVDLETLPLVLSAGATRVAVVRAVAAATDPEKAARALKQVLSQIANRP